MTVHGTGRGSKHDPDPDMPREGTGNFVVQSTACVISRRYSGSFQFS